MENWFEKPRFLADLQFSSGRR